MLRLAKKEERFSVKNGNTRRLRRARICSLDLECSDFSLRLQASGCRMWASGPSCCMPVNTSCYTSGKREQLYELLSVPAEGWTRTTTPFDMHYAVPVVSNDAIVAVSIWRNAPRPRLQRMQTF